MEKNDSLRVLDMDDFPKYPNITYKKHTFLSSLILGLSTIIITILICCTVLIIFGSIFVGERSDKLISLTQKAISGLPELRETLPPALADVLDDHRQPDYAAELDIVASTTCTSDPNGTILTKIEVVNKGSKVVSLLCLRIVVFNSNDEILTESNEWIATPVAAEQSWRGLLMPGSHRYLASSHRAHPVSPSDELKTEIEITDLRIWNPPKKDALIEDRTLTSDS
jgi:hypothetical protein